MHTMTKLIYIFGTLFGFLLLPDIAIANDVPNPNNELVLPSEQFYSLVIGSLAPLVGYVLNHHAPWVDEKIKGIVQVVVAAAAGALYQALDAGDLGLNTETLQVVFTAIVGALFAHRILWRPSSIANYLGAGSNKQPIKGT